MNLDSAYFDVLRVRRILVPVDFSMCTLGTLRYAGRMARQFHATVSLLHVMPMYIHRSYDSDTAGMWTRTACESCQTELDRLAEILKAVEIPTLTMVRTGPPLEMILGEAENLGVDLIVMGRRGRGWLSRLLRHHTVDRVIRRAQCPVMVIRSGVDDFGPHAKDEDQKLLWAV